MELLIIATSIIQSIAISLGVGASTIAIANFFVAISDGKIDETERKMMGVTYIILRVAMGLILLTAILLPLFDSTSFRLDIFTTYAYAQWVLLFVLYVNAVLMTKHIMPSTYGPALQASSWYTLGITVSLVPLGYADFTLTQFILGYGAMIILCTALVRGSMAYLKAKKS